MAKRPLMPNITLEELKEIQEGFRLLLARLKAGEGPLEEYYGICANTCVLLGGWGRIGYWGERVNHLVAYLAANWPHTAFPGKAAMFPFPRDRAYTPWNGPNLALRINLLRYCIKRLRDIIRRRERAQAQLPHTV